MTGSYVLEFLIGLCLLQLSTAALPFQQVNSSAGWAPRRSAQVHRLHRPLTYLHQNRSFQAPIGSFVLYGGLCQSLPFTQCNDVWLSPDRGQSWNSISQTADSYTTYYSSAVFSDPVTDQLYVMADGGYPGGHGISPLWTTRNLSHWNLTLPKTNAAPTWDRSSFSCVIDSQSHIYYLTSQNYTLASTPKKHFFHEIWQSRNMGQSWSVVTTAPAFPARVNSGLSIHLNNSHLQNRDIIYVLGGGGPSSPNMKDIWVSSDSALSWSRVNTEVPWQYTWMSSFHITLDGGLLIATDSQYPQQRGTLWLSLDGGYTWGICVEDPVYYPRIAASVITDSEGYPYVIAGTTGDGNFNNDVWRGTISLKNLTGIAAACDLKVPAGGVGLSQWPGGSTGSSSSSTADSHGSSSPTGTDSASGTGGSSSSSNIASTASSSQTSGDSASGTGAAGSSSSSSSTAGSPSFSHNSNTVTIALGVVGLGVAVLLIGSYLGYRYFRRKGQDRQNAELHHALIQ